MHVAELSPHDGDVEEDESDAGDDDVEEAVQEEDVQARVDVRVSEALMKYLVELCSAPSVPQAVFTITGKALNRAFFWLKVLTSAFILKTLSRHYAKQVLTNSK